MSVSPLSARKYAWDYFLAHAQARLTTFRFYLFYCTIILTGLFRVFTTEKAYCIGIALSLLLGFISFIYMKIDERHKGIIKLAQNALIEIEAAMDFSGWKGNVDKIRLFTSDRNSKDKGAIVFTYSKCVKFVFYTFIFISVMSLGASIELLICK